MMPSKTRSWSDEATRFGKKTENRRVLFETGRRLTFALDKSEERHN